MNIKMTMLSEFEAPRGSKVFRWSLGRTLVPTVSFSILTLLGLWELFSPYAFTEFPTFMLVSSTLGFLFFAWIAWAQTRAGIGPGSLVAVVDRENLWVKIRSPLNKHVGTAEDDQLVAVPLSCLKWSQLYSVKTLSRVGSQVRSRTEDFLHIGFQGLDTTVLKDCLESERERRKTASTTHGHYPIKILNEDTLRIDLQNVSGGASGLQKVLPGNVERRERHMEMVDNRPQ